MDASNGAIDKMAENHDKSAGIWAVFKRALLYVFMVAIIAVIVSILPILMFFLEEIEKGELDSLPADTVTYMLIIVIILYMTQAFTVTLMSLKRPKIGVVVVHGRSKEIPLTGISILTWTISDTIRNGGPWVFLIVAIFLPVMLSFIPDAILISSRDTNVSIPEDPVPSGVFLSEVKFRIAGMMYYLCLSLIAVLITVEASILMNLKDTAGFWIGMVLVSTILDIASFLILYSMGDPLEKWNGQGFEAAGAVYFLLLAFFCTISSFLTIVFARASREMIFEVLVLERIESEEEATPKN